jgi:hypothetical protein
VSEDTFEVKIFIKDNISHYFLRRDLLPEQELLEEQQRRHAALPGGAREPDPAAAVLLAADIQILEPNWLKEKLLKTLEAYLAQEPAR